MGELEIVQGKLFDQIGVHDLVIQEMNAKALTLKINGVEDKKGKQEVHELRMLYVTTRNNVVRHGKAKRESAVKYQKDVIAEEKRVLEMLAKGESHLVAEEQAVDDALEAIKKEQARVEELHIQTRRDRLAALGVGFNGQMWSFQNVNLPEAMLKVSSDEQFEALFSKFQDAFNAEQMRIEAEREKQKEESDRLARLAADQETERLRLEVIQKEQDEKARLLSEESDRLANTEAARLRDAQKIIQDKLRAQELEKVRQDAAEKARLETEAKIKREADEKIKKEWLSNIAAEKKAARRPDKEKLLGFADYLEAMIPPTMKTTEAQTILSEVMDGLSITVKKLRDKLEAL